MSLCSPFLSLLIAFVPSKPENLITLASSLPLAENMLSVLYKLIAFLKVVIKTGKFVPASTYQINNIIWDLPVSSVLSSAGTVTSPIAKISFTRFSSRNTLGRIVEDSDVGSSG